MEIVINFSTIHVTVFSRLYQSINLYLYHRILIEKIAIKPRKKEILVFLISRWKSFHLLKQLLKVAECHRK